MALSGSFVGTTNSDRLVPVIRWSATQDEEKNESTVTATLYYYRTNSYTTSGDWTGTITIDGNTISESGVWAYIQQTEYEIISHTVTVPHNVDGSKTITISATGRVPGTTLESTAISATITLDQINRTSILTCNDGTLGTAQTLSVSRKSSDFTHTITYACNTASGTICSESKNESIAWTPGLNLAQQNTTGTSVSITVKIETFADGASIGSRTYLITCAIPESVKPSCVIAVSDPDGHANKYGAYVQGFSRVKVVTTPTLAQGASIASYAVKIGESTYNGQTVTSQAIMSTGEITVTVTIKDTRGRTATASKTINVLAYVAPAITLLKTQRCDAFGAENSQGPFAKIIFSAAVTALNDKNTAQYTLEYKKSKENDYTSIDVSAYTNNYLVSNAEKVVDAAVDLTYDVCLTVKDDFGSSSKTAVVSTWVTLMHWLASGIGMAIGKIAELTNVLDIGFRTRFYGGVLPVSIASGTNLNDLMTANVYSGGYIPTYSYGNAPITEGTFSLEVLSTADDALIIQRLTSGGGAQEVYTRQYYNGVWSAWTCVQSKVTSLQNSVTSLQNNVASLQNSIKSYADGFLHVSATITGMSTSCAFSLPSGATDCWIDSAWIKDGQTTYMVPKLATDGGVDALAYIENANTVVILCPYGYTGGEAHFVIAYKK